MNQTEKLILNEIRGFFLDESARICQNQKNFNKRGVFMHIQRIQVPDFRVLKNVDITFEKDFSPRIFPFGSQNGGGKSTLLQLTFMLLHSFNFEHLHFLYNILRSFKVKNSESEKILAIIDIWDGKRTVKLEFLGFGFDYVRNNLSNDPNNFTSKEISEAAKNKGMIYIATSFNSFNDYLFCRPTNIDINEIYKFWGKLSQKIFLAAPSDQVFLFLPQESKRLLFTKKADKDDNKQVNNYYSALKDAKSDLKGFFTYDFFATDIFIEMFQNARDKDFEEAVKTGIYGNNYNMLLNELNSLLTNKKVNVTPDLSGVVFKEERDGKTIELEPEDLSHGELKRLSIYMWLKHRKIEDSIVLMDEIENGFHLDWQYRIISDLKEWAPNNQYILATHSYDLCQSLTPKHVKELEPKLLKSVSN